MEEIQRGGLQGECSQILWLWLCEEGGLCRLWSWCKIGHVNTKTVPEQYKDGNGECTPTHQLTCNTLYHQRKLSCQRISSSEGKGETAAFYLRALIVTSALKTANQCFCITPRLIMVHHHATLGPEKCKCSSNSVGTNFYGHFEPLLWPWASI